MMKLRILPVALAAAALLCRGDDVQQRLAEDPERFGRRQTHDEVMKLVTDTKLDLQMKAFAQWDDFTAGKRRVR
jgi:hypothetical protein